MPLCDSEESKGSRPLHFKFFIFTKMTRREAGLFCRLAYIAKLYYQLYIEAYSENTTDIDLRNFICVYRFCRLFLEEV